MVEDNTLRLVLTDHWFNKIKSGEKTHEYREAKPFWIKRITTDNQPLEMLIKNQDEFSRGFMFAFTKVKFQKAYRKNAETMLFWARDVYLVNGLDTDLKIDKWVFDIDLGTRIE